MESVLESSVLVTILVIVGGLYAAVVAWKSFDYVLMERRRRRENPPPPGGDESDVRS
jgi:hypothetical protein